MHSNCFRMTSDCVTRERESSGASMVDWSTTSDSKCSKPFLIKLINASTDSILTLTSEQLHN